MRSDDGRMAPNFVTQALSGEPLTVHGDGTQTRSIQYVDALIEGVFSLMHSSESRPVNIGNPHEMSVLQLAELVIRLSGSESKIISESLPEDDPKRRCPDISRAREVLRWEPQVPAKKGLKVTLEWFAEHLGNRHRETPAP
jgi:dTDP-glucose 4,6-dehydratase